MLLCFGDNGLRYSKPTRNKEHPKATVVVKTVHEKCCLVENAATRDEERPIGSRYDILLGRANIPTQTVTLIEDLRVDDRTIRQVDRTIKVSDRCVKI